MTASDKKKSVVLVLLLAVAGLSWFYYRPTTGSASNVAAKAPVKPKPTKLNQDAQIRIDLVPDTSSVSVGQSNLFQYRQKPVALAARPTEQTRPAVITQVSPTPTPTPVNLPPPVPWKPFRYEGFSVSKGGGKILGSITESGNTYEVKEGDCMMGQFCVTRLTESMVEIEDLQLKRKQTFTFTRTQ
jgi:hypothetical protein